MARLRPTRWGTCVKCHAGAILYEGDDGDVCEHCASLIGLQAQLDEARAHIEALMEKCWQVDDFGIECIHCGATCDNGNTKHHVGCSYVAARKWLEAQDDDS